MPSDQDDADALFGTAAPAAAPAPAKQEPEQRKESRVRANWPARVLLPGDRIVQLNVYDLSESGIGLVSSIGIPAHSVLPIALAVPGLHEATRITAVQGTVKTTHMTIRGNDIHCGGVWVQLGSDARDLLSQWIRRLRK